MKVPQSLRDLVEGAESIVFIEDLSNKEGLLQTINPLVKLVATISMIVVSLCIFHLSYLVVICAIPIILAIVSRIPLKRFFIRATLIPIFAAIISIPVLFFTYGSPIFTTNIGITTLTITSEGLTRFLVFTIRVWFCVASLTLLILSTGFEKILKLLSTIKVPGIIVQLFALTYRYFFVSIHEAQSVLIAKEARTYVNKRTINMQALRDLGTILATLFIRTYERSERVYLAMKARGFEIDNSSKLTMPSLRARDIGFASSIIITFALFALL
ncbi:MAG: cobalt ECF transporter T component CbiQ [Candidatus Bathyarchaeota archaeon]